MSISYTRLYVTSWYKAWFPPMRLTYSRKNKLISLMRLLVDRIKIFNLMRSHQISQISHFRIKYEYSVFRLKEKTSRHAFFCYLFLYTLYIKAGEFLYLLRNPSSFKYDLTIFPKILTFYYSHYSCFSISICTLFPSLIDCCSTWVFFLGSGC